MGAKGTTTIDFGSSPGVNLATTVITGQTAISSNSDVEAWMMADITADHTDVEHIMVDMKLICGSLVAGTGFTIYATSSQRLTGLWNVHWVWD